MKNPHRFYRYLATVIADTPWNESALTTQLNYHLKPVGCLDEWLKILLQNWPKPVAKHNLLPYLQADADLREQLLSSKPYFVVIPVEFSKSELISPQLPALDNEADLARWLGWDNQVLGWYMNRRGLSRQCTQALQHYRLRFIDKRRGGQRLIEAPKVQLKTAQARINEKILQFLPLSPVSYGFVRGRNCLQHASLHQHKAVVLGFDIEDCFLSVNGGQVHRAFRHLGYSNSVARALMALCTHRQGAGCHSQGGLSARQKSLLTSSHLPQGAPSSPSLANFALSGVDNRLVGYFKKMGATYSRYADDITVSGDRRLQKRYEQIHAWLGSVLLEEGFLLNYRKSKCMTQAMRQQVTGISVNQSVNLPRKRYEALKAELHNCVRHGWSTQTALSKSAYRAHLLGSIEYVRQLNLAKASKLSGKFGQIKW